MNPCRTNRQLCSIMKHFPCRSGYWVWDRIRRYPVACREKPAITKLAFVFEANVLLKQQALQKYTCRTTNPIKVLHCASIWRFYCQRGSIDTAIKRWWRHNVTAGPFLWKIKTLPCYFVSINHSWLTNLTITQINVNINCYIYGRPLDHLTLEFHSLLSYFWPVH